MTAKSALPAWMGLDPDNRTQLVAEYIYGVRGVSLQERDISQTSALVMNPINVEGEVEQVSLTVDAELPTGTSIEYDISFLPNPSEGDWHPILPMGTSIVRDEQIFFSGRMSASLPLRFEPDETAHPFLLKMNGAPLPRGVWSYEPTTRCIVLGFTRSAKSDFHIDYVPLTTASKDPQILHVLDSERIQEDIVDKFPLGTDMFGTITLSKYPYVDSDKIGTASWSPLQINLYGAMAYSTGLRVLQATKPDVAIQDHCEFSGVALPLLYTQNMTDYTTKDPITLEQYDPTWDTTITPQAMTHPVFEYEHRGRSIRFTETFSHTDVLGNEAHLHGNAAIWVEYKRYALQARLRVVLRGDGTTYTPSPVLNQYILSFGIKGDNTL